ncbi:MAG TPA: ABC transporter ATP-binding protein [Deltaproteobacteria bacterium]|nr:ABC transporter ATP-binding protein [Deltaproteobacteria bacterium]
MADFGFFSAVRLVRPFFRRYRLRLLVGLLALLAVDFLQLVIPRIIKGAVDLLASGAASETLLVDKALLILLVAAGIAVSRFLWRYLVLGFSRLLERDLRDWLFSHLLRLDYPFFQKKPVGEIMALATNDLAAVQLAGGMGLVAAADACIMSLAALACMAYISLPLTLLTLLPMPLLALLTRVLSRRIHKGFTRVQHQFSKLTEFARSTIANIHLFKAYGRTAAQIRGFDYLGRAYVRDNVRLAAVHGTLFPLAGLVGNLSLFLVLFFGGRLVIVQKISIGDFVAFVSYLYMLTWPMMAIGWVANLFQRGVTSLGRINEVLIARPQLVGPEAPLAPPAAVGEIEVRNLDFGYEGQERPVLQNINFQIKAGEFVGVVGKTGSGKSTLCNILARLYPVAGEAFFWGGVDVNQLDLAAVRSSIAYVPQEVVLFSRSIAANIAFGKPSASQAEIEEAAAICGIHDEIMAFADGYQTMVGEKGVKLSGGQRQRIALARAVLLKRSVVIIDDSLSAVDMETEQAIIQALARYFVNRTCIVVSHRIAPLKNADSILVMADGAVVAQGRHGELMARNSFYATICRQQRVDLSHGEEGHHA